MLYSSCSTHYIYLFKKMLLLDINSLRAAAPISRFTWVSLQIITWLFLNIYNWSLVMSESWWNQVWIREILSATFTMPGRSRMGCDLPLSPICFGVVSPTSHMCLWVSRVLSLCHWTSQTHCFPLSTLIGVGLSKRSWVELEIPRCLQQESLVDFS